MSHISRPCLCRVQCKRCATQISKDIVLPVKGGQQQRRKANAAKFLDDNPALATEIDGEIRRQTMSLPVSESDVNTEAEAVASEEPAEG